MAISSSKIDCLEDSSRETLHGSVLSTYLALKRFHRQVDNHVRFECLFLNKGLKADMALERAHTGVNQHVSLQVGREGELTRTDVTFVFLHTLEEKDNSNIFRDDSIATTPLKVTFVISLFLYWFFKSKSKNDLSLASAE